MSTPQRPLVYYVATTLDHYIAHADGSVDGFLTEGDHIPDYMNSLAQFDTVIMGRNTYEFGYQYGLVAGEPVPTYGAMMQYVVSQTMPAYNHPQLQVIRDDVAQWVAGLKSQAGKPIYLCGGGQLAGHLLDAGLIDDLIVKINPVLFGDGIPLFGTSQRQVALAWRNSTTYPNGVMFVQYKLIYPTA